MKLKKVDARIKHQKDERPLAYASLRGGTLTFNEAARALMCPADDWTRLDVFRDEDCPRDFYVSINNESGQYKRIEIKKQMKGERVYISVSLRNRHLIRQILEANKIEDTRARFLVGQPVQADGITLYCLIYMRE
jgi:hypothetical protein